MIRFLLTRLLKVFLVGFYLLLGASLTLAGFGLIPEWSGFLGDGQFLHELWVNPWSIFAACCWFGIGVLFFNERPPPVPILDKWRHAAAMRRIRSVRTHLEESVADPRLIQATELLALAVEELADELRDKDDTD